MSGNSGPFLFSYNSKNTLNRIIFDSNRRRREGFENANPSPKSSQTPKKPTPSPHLGRRTPLQTRSFQGTLFHDADEDQQEHTSPRITYQASPDDAYMRQNDSILVSPGGISGLQSRIHVTDESMVSPPPEAFRMTFDDCMAQLKNWNNQLREYAETTQKLTDLRQQHEGVSRRLLAAESELKESRHSVSSALVEIKAKEAEKKLLESLCAETKAQLVLLAQNNDRLKVELASVRAEAERLKTGLETYKARLAQFSESIAALGSGLRELGEAHKTAREQLQLVRMEFEDIKRKTTNGLEELRPVLDDNATLDRAQEMKALLKELQESLVSSHQVTDILRGKILHQASQLADAQARVKELEEQSLAKLYITAEDNKNHIALLIDMGKNIEEVTEKLIIREKEALDALVTAASLEANLEAVSKELETCKATCATHATEREENLSRFLSLQNTINGRDKEIAILKADLRGLKESKEDLRVLLGEAKKDLADKESEIRAKDPNIEFQLKIQDLQIQVGSFKIRLQEAEEKQRSSFEDWLAQENALKKRLYESEGIAIALRACNEQLQANVLSLRAELTTLVVEDQTRHEELRLTKNEVSKIQERFDTRGIELTRSKEEYNKLNLRHRELEARMEEKDRLLRVQERRAAAAESSAVWTNDQLAVANRKTEVIEEQMVASNREASFAKKAAEEAVSSIKNESSAQLIVLQKKILQLESANAQADGRGEKLLELYRTGKLTDSEKSFVSHIISQTEALQEERVVKKDNELRLREISLENANSKLATAQETILRLLAEKNGKGNGVDRSMVDLGEIPAEASKLAAGLALDLMANDPEDDIPLTQLQSELEVEEGNKHGIKRSRSPSPRWMQKRSKMSSAIEASNDPVGGSSAAQQKVPTETVTKKNKGRRKK